MTVFHIGFLLYPELTQLDMTGPAQFLARMTDARLHFVWKTLDPVPTDAGFFMVPTATFETCPQLDMLCVTGGAGQLAIMDDPAVLGWLKRQGEAATWLTSVCTGSLLLGAAGLLQGRRVACHWAFREMVAGFGATAVPERVVRDGNYIGGGGVTAGIDFALTVIATLRGEEEAKLIQLALEYDPQPPFDVGPDRAPPALVAAARDLLLARRRELAEA